MNMKKIASILLAAAMTAAFLAGCTGGNDTSSGGNAPGDTGMNSSGTAGTNFDASTPITVISREDGSGTRGAFIELFGVEVKGDDGTKTDMTTKEANFINSTAAVLTGVAGDEYAIGYISLGSMNDTVKALRIDGSEASAGNVKNGSYKVARPFNIATKGEPTGLAKDFIDFVMSKEGQAVVSNGYIPVAEDAAAYAGSRPAGTLMIAGSSSVTPVMEKLKEAYTAINPGADIQINQSDSTAGMTSAIDGTCQIGMASRELKESELAELTPVQIALDGIAVVVNPENPVDELTSEQVKSIYTGETADWSSMVK